MSGKCPRCSASARLRPGDFSDQSWSLLVVGGEIEKKDVGKHLCDECNDEMREALVYGIDTTPVYAENFVAKTKAPTQKAASATKKISSSLKNKKKKKVATKSGKSPKKTAKVVKISVKKKKVLKKRSARKLAS